MKALWCIMLAALAGLFLTACRPAEEAPLCGGVTDRTDHSAPKVINSKEITALDASFWLTDEESSRGGRWELHVFRDGSGRLFMKADGVQKGQVQADEALIAALQDIIDRFELAKFNGIDRVTAGLPPQSVPHD